MRAFLLMTKAAFISFLFIAGNVSAQPAQIPAFPGAEGYGALAKGGRGGRVIEVTNLNDSGPGSLRAAVTAAGARIVVFRVGGTIELKSDLVIRGEEQAYLTIAGQTAPGGGILLKNYGLQIIDTHDIVVRYLRIRPGQWDFHRKMVYGILIHQFQQSVHDVILDHISESWHTDDNAIEGNIYNVTFQWCIFAEGILYVDLYGANRGTGFLMNGCGPDRTPNQVSFHHNLLINNNYRNPLVSGGRHQLINNVIYNPRRPPTFMTGETPANWNCDVVPHNIDFIGNYYKAGPDTRPNKKEISFVFVEKLNPVKNVFLYLRDNYGWNYDINDPYSIVQQANYNKRTVPLRPGPQIPVTVQDFEEAKDLVIRNAGATLPQRDEVDNRLIREFNTNTGHIDKGSDWPHIASGTAPKDTDHDGMPDVWELTHGFDPNNPSDGNKDADGDGYTNIEEYLNNLTKDMKPRTSTAVLDASINEVGNTEKLTTIEKNKWYELNIQYDGWENISFSDVWINHNSINEGTIQNRGGRFFSSKNYVMSLSISTDRIFAREIEGTASSMEITGKLGLYVDDDSSEYVQDVNRRWVTVKFKFLENALPGTWTINAYIRKKDGGISDLFQKNILVVSDVDLPTAFINIRESLPIKADSVHITLTTSKTVTQVPTPLLFTESDGSITIVNLQGILPGKTFLGIFIVDNSVANGPGSFSLPVDALVDENGNKNNQITSGAQIVIDKSSPPTPTNLPTAAITLSDPSPTKAGSVQVTLTTSTNVTSVPSPLIFTESDNSTTNITLQGTVPGNTFSGIFMVDNTVADGVGKFSLPANSLVDENGEKGQEITAGLLVVIDKTPPSAPKNVRVIIAEQE